MKKKTGILSLVLLLCLLICPASIKAAAGWMSVERPYQYTEVTEYLPTSTNSFTVGGTTYNEGYKFYLWNAARTSQVLYNLKEEYTTFSFQIGHVDGTKNYSANLVVYLDGIVSQTIPLTYTDISKQVTLNVSGVNSLKLALTSNEPLDRHDITYALFNGTFVKSGKTAPKVQAANWVNNCEPYNINGEKTGLVTGDNAVLMGGDAYYDALQLYLWNPYRKSEVYYNLGGYYKSISFVVGHIDNTTRSRATLVVKRDGVTAASVAMQPDALPVPVTIDLVGVQQLSFELISPEAGNVYHTYYGIGSAVLKSNGQVRGVKLNKNSLNLTQANSSERLTAAVIPNDASNTSVSWKSSDTSVATVSSTGVVKAVGNGTAVITVKTVSGSWTADCTVSVSGMPVSVKTASVSVASAGAYTGKAIKPAVKVTLNGTTLVKDQDYTLSYSNNINAGKAKVTVRGIGKYSGYVSKSFTISKAAQKFKVKVSKTSLAIGKTMSVKTNGIGTVTFKSGSTKRLAVSSKGTVRAKSAGKVKLTVKAAGNANYKSASKTIVIKVIPKSTSITAIRNSGTRKVTLRWKPVSGVTGYQVLYTDGSPYKVVTVRDASEASLVIRKLNKNKTYKVKIRTYKKVGTYNCYSEWSAVKKVKITR